METGVISTIPDRCKRCYSCVRECPAKAIKVVNGQALVMTERCVACGHCIKVCSQGAKRMREDVDLVERILEGEGENVAIVAPSFAASFPGEPKRVTTAIRDLGFDKVVETAFGADLVSIAYHDLYAEHDSSKPIVASPCPAINNLVQKYYAELAPNLAPVVSPMIALGRFIKKKWGADRKVVFFGPCTAKKLEIEEEEVGDAIDAVLTFTELKTLFAKRGIDVAEREPSEFDQPRAGLGKAFPLAGGLLKSASISGDTLDREIVVVEGKQKALELIQEIAEGNIDASLVDILFCEGCISGPAIESDLNYYSRRQKVVDFVREDLNRTDKKLWKSHVYNARDLDLTRTFEGKSQRRPTPDEKTIREILARTNKLSEEDQLNCGACGYHTCREHAVAVAKGLGEEEMCLPFLIEELQSAYDNLHTAREQLHQAEKLASIGQLAAGVAHEINNPLGAIMMYASLVKRTLAKLECQNAPKEDLELIVKEAQRCKNIVANLLNFARQGRLNLSTFDLNELVEETLKKTRIDPKYGDVIFETKFESPRMEIEGDREQLEQTIANILSNGADAMETTDGEKRLTTTVRRENDGAIVEVEDCGCGVPEENFGKIFTPFFTTKKIGKGAGLGLAIVYGIVKMHRGQIRFENREEAGARFILELPIEQRKNKPIEETEIVAQ
ncbi:MAG: GHKL domain-containing protein [Ignavibacteriales bacterium]|nr:GHKL domain-containing protein [Ignavibacteriales bacterium]